ncbi:hypothetical protein ACH4NF_34920 [Streptomyces sp. NPDC017248]|uniref:hypothetical protein n=1 Tax=unclassified Streptomyces TaxID=2593676 RepID=UPI00378F2301
MATAPGNLLYFDDEPTFVRAAAAAGLQAHLFISATDVQRHLNQCGVNVRT